MSFRPPRALLLDLDDTILAYAPLADPLWERVTTAFAPGLGIAPSALLDAIRRAGRLYWGEPERSRAGRHDMRGARRSICLWAFRELGLPELAGAALADAFHDAREAAVEPLPGALDALEQFRSRGLPLALVTNGGSELQRRKVERFGLAGFFEEILIEGELGYGKPDLRVFGQALLAVGAPAEEVWMVGDNLHADVAGAQSSGITGVWVDAEERGIPQGIDVAPDHRIRGLAELIDRL
ncbi:MAG: phosphoglycolate phosphatase [Deltaproteobacteria bacterium]|jgi:putative hydrolase of the HAD superfamily|nr:phosphoglycolate phosphatase [Deltaproteobacteria bacterium]